MLSFEDSLSLESLLVTMRTVDDKTDYLQQVLLPALLRGDWLELNKMVVYQDEKLTILFGDDEWLFKKSAYKGKGIANFYFGITKDKNVTTLNKSERNLINEIKCMALATMWFLAAQIELEAIKNKINILRTNVVQFMRWGISSFEELDQKALENMIDENVFETNKPKAFTGLNALYAVRGLLPFDINFPSLTHATFQTKQPEQAGTLVIPPRIYFSALTTYSQEIVKAYGLRDEIELAVEKMISFYDHEVSSRLKRIRNGGKYSPRKSYKKSWDRFVSALEQEGIPLIDNGNNPKWLKIFTALKTKVRPTSHALDQFNVFIGDTCYKWSEFTQYICDLSGKAQWLCLALSGMRIGELYSISPVFGAQKMHFDKDGCESETGKEVIYFLTTRQSKISLNSQTKDDTFVTTVSGYKAFHVLNAIHAPYRSRFDTADKHLMFAGLNGFQYWEPLGSKGSLGQFVQDKFNNDCFDFVLTADDMGYLTTSDPTQTSFKLGEKFYFTPHQARRSLAYYLIGYELCAFPALKQQFSHLSLAMTRWYARNAYSFEKIYAEIQRERVIQQAELFVQIYKKMANGERIAGGQGRARINEISREGESYFENGINKRKLSRDYWIDLLTNGKAHLHAIAPGMYCTNTQCSMRINIDLTECVDCEFDFIENAVYAEATRMDAMRNLEFLQATKELNASAATKYFMQIKAAEAIMQDLGFSYEQYKFDAYVLNLVIETKVVA